MWKPVVGFESYYEVSDAGEVRRVAAGRGAVAGRLITTKRLSYKGYPVIELSVGDIKTRKFLHRIVAEALLGPAPTNSHMVNHLDGVKVNCAVANLEWTTAKGNAEHAALHGLTKPMCGESNGRAKLTATQVSEIRSLKLGHAKTAALFGVSRSLVQRIRQGKVWSEWPADLRVRQFPEVPHA